MSKNTESLRVLGRCGLKYIDELGIEYFVDGEMIVSNEYDYVMWTDSIMYWEDYIKQSSSENIEYTEFFDEKSVSRWIVKCPQTRSQAAAGPLGVMKL